MIILRTLHVHVKANAKLNTISTKVKVRSFSATKTRLLHNVHTNNRKHDKDDKMRVAIIGAGASGMSTALHLAPLVEKGLLAAPIDIYEKSSPTDVHPHESQKSDEHFHPGSGHVGRKVGIGIWSTALEPFLRNCSGGSSSSCNSTSTHLNLIQDLEDKGQYVGRVGYRMPSGKYLTRGKLNTKGFYSQYSNSYLLNMDGSSTKNMDENDNNNNNDNDDDPALLFIREKDFLSSLRKACEIEEKNHGTIRIHNNTEVEDVVLPTNVTSDDEGHSGYLKFANSDTSETSTKSSKSYHFIIAAEGMMSNLRMKYAGYSSLEKKWKKKTGVSAKLSEEWEEQVLEEQNGIEDRGYTVFRGNSPLSNLEAHMADGVSYQTWGEGKSMRFAAVGMSHPSSSGGKDDRTEEQVWFATICDRELIGIQDAEQRKKLLVDTFKNWHDPVGSLIESTPAKEILMERGVAHKHSVYPVFNLSQVIHYQQQSARRKNNENVQYSSNLSSGPGPTLMFTGDAGITVDPVLAQGFTIAMESAADLAQTLEVTLADTSYITGNLPFNPIRFRDDLTERNQRRYERNLCLIRASELVQAISQPSDSFTGFLSNNVIRPAIMLTPSFIKEAVFSYMMKYSLGVYGSTSLYNKSSCDISRCAKIGTLQNNK